MEDREEFNLPLLAFKMQNGDHEPRNASSLYKLEKSQETDSSPKVSRRKTALLTP